MTKWELARVLRKMFGDPRRVTDALVGRICEIERFPGNRAGLIGHYLALSDDVVVEAGLPTLHVPVLIEWGGLDTVQPRAAAEMFRRQIPGARLIIYPGVGHDVIEEAPAASERDAAAFLSAQSRRDYLWKITIRPRIVAALMSHGADLCHGCRVFDSRVAASFFSWLGMFNSGSSKEGEGSVWADAIRGDVT